MFGARRALLKEATGLLRGPNFGGSLCDQRPPLLVVADFVECKMIFCTRQFELSAT